MSELVLILTDIAKSLVDNPGKVSVEGTEDNNNVELHLYVDADDIGKVIGKNGHIAKSIRTVMRSAGNLYGKRVTVEIED